jgi:hypothetical protein
MLNEVVRCIGWSNSNDRETIIRKEDIEGAIPNLKQMEKELVLVKGGVGAYIRRKGIHSVHDVLVILRRLSRANGHAVIYKRASKNKNNKPVYLYNLI